ncbi:type 4 prepilin peptidase 1 [Agaricicola taiwanensis]|uniref:Type 4 prepilin peptidase 1 n=1 Tax=Agaricicola taiwanensis TaxID=591372 RepID=A0A8J2VJQ0_9RHOB|nr:prepilin peptidase [Agaricicola taiwanensis]GGE33167.1 type 4 prepilin peptidase 1 [Agaricicola taiwanensis]
MASTIVISFIVAALGFCALSDFFTMKIPNSVTLTFAAMFPLAAAALNMGTTPVVWHIAAGSVVLIVCFFLFSMGWLGGGDAKLAAGVALWIGFDLLMPWLLMTAIIGGALTLLVLFARRLPLPTLLHRQEWALRLHDIANGIPYGIAISAGALWVLPMSFWAKALS